MKRVVEKSVVDRKGRKIGIFLTIKEWKKMLAELEELEAIRAYDEAKSSKDEKIPFEKAVSEIEGKSSRV